MAHWARRECEAWRNVTRLDPFLPSRFLSRDYIRKECWVDCLRLFRSWAVARRYLITKCSGRNTRYCGPAAPSAGLGDLTADSPRHEEQ